MASKRHQRRKRHRGKQAYPDEASARWAASRFQRLRPSERWSFYACTEDGPRHWHVGHTPRKILQSIAARHRYDS